MKKLLGALMATCLWMPASLSSATEKLADIEEGINIIAPFTIAQSKAKDDYMNDASAEGQSNRVLNGTEADPGEYPYQVAMLVVDEQGRAQYQFCGGSMIQPQWMLTAAHCVVDVKDDGLYLADATKMGMYVGSTDLRSGGDLIAVEKIVVHPSYNPNGFDGDIALIKLKRVPKTSFEVIKIPTEKYANILEKPSVETIVTGWGRTETGKSAMKLMEGKIELIDRKICNSVLLKPRIQKAAQTYAATVKTLKLDGATANKLWKEMNASVPEPINQNMLCSGSYLGPRGACDGDSGGPLVLKQKDGTLIQAGVVSWGMMSSTQPGCAQDMKFSAYTRVGNYTDWVLEVLGYK